jgi:hypothetical protein
MASATKEVRLRETDSVEYESVLYSLRRRMTITCDYLPGRVLQLDARRIEQPLPADVSPRPDGSLLPSEHMLILHEDARLRNPWTSSQM